MNLFNSSVIKNKLRLLPAVLLLLLVVSFMIPSCGRNENKERKISRADSVLRVQMNNLYSNPDLVEKELTKTLKEVKDSTSIYKLTAFIGIAYFIRGNDDAFAAKFAQVKDYSSRYPDDSQVAGIYWNQLAVVSQLRGLRDSALVCYQRAYGYILQTHDEARVIDVCINIGDVYMQNGDLARSAQSYRRALFLSDSLDIHHADFAILAGLGGLYSDLGDYGTSDNYFTQAKGLLKETTDYDKFFYFTTMGNSYCAQQRYKEAESVLRKAYNSAITLRQKDLMVIAESNLGESMMYQDRLDSAHFFIKRAEALSKQLPAMDNGQKFYMSSLLGDLALRENDLSSAHKYLSTAVVDTAMTMPRYLYVHFQRISRYSEHRGDYREAYRSLKLSSRFKDSLENQRSRNQIRDLEYRYRQDTTLLKSRIAVDLKEKEVQHLHLWIYGIVMVVIVVALLSIVIVLMLRRRRQVEETAMRNSLYSLRMENIRNRISPHFVFNVLNREMDMTSPGVVNLVRLLRKNLEMCNRYVVPLKDELDFINSYIDTERGALGDRFTYECSVAQTVDCERTLIPSMMIQIFVENAVKHGLRGFDGDKYLRINLSHNGGSLEVSIRNNGNAYSKTNASQSTGTGLRIVTQTIQILNERNVRKIDLKFGQDTDADGTKAWNVRIKIPDDYDFSRISDCHVK